MPSIFYVHFEHDGGCDYTIACGELLVRLPDTVKTMEEAYEKVIKVVDGEDGVDDYKPWQLGNYSDPSVEKATIYEVEAFRVVNVPRDFERPFNELRRAKKRKVEEERERKQLEILKQKYEGK